MKESLHVRISCPDVRKDTDDWSIPHFLVSCVPGAEEIIVGVTVGAQRVTVVSWTGDCVLV